MADVNITVTDVNLFDAETSPPTGDGPKIPSIPVFSNDPGSLRIALDKVKETIDIREGRIGSKFDKYITWRDLFQSGITQVTLNGVSYRTNATAPSVAVATDEVSFAPPPAPTGFTATGGFTLIQLQWTDPQTLYRNHSYTEVWRSTSNNLGTAVMLGTSSGRFYVDSVGNAVTYYYWVRFVSTAAVKGPYNATNGTSASTSPDPAFLISLLTGQITSTQLDNTLTSRINLIDGNSSVTNSVNARVAAVGSRIDTLQGQVSELAGTPAYSSGTTYATNALVTYNGGLYRARQSTTGNLPTNNTYWEKIGDYTSLGQAVAVNSASITQLVTDLSSEISARTALASQVNNAATGLAATQATLTNDYYTKAAADTATAAAITALSSSINIGNYVTTSTLTNNYYTTANTNNAISTAISNLATTFNNTLTGYTNTATLNSNYYTKTDANTAISNATTNLVSSSTLNNALGSYTTTAALQTNYYTKASGQSLEGQYTVKVDLNGYVSGFGLASTANNATASSNFAVRADTFYIANPTGPGISPSMPFIVRTAQTTINGVNVPAGVYITEAFIANGTITNAKIGDAAIDNAKIANLDAAKITSGFISADRIQAGTLDAKIANIDAAVIGSGTITNARIGDVSSTNYSAGSAGWRIAKDGSAEFNTGTFRGNLTVGSSPAVSGTTMTGSGGTINSGGNFALGNATTNITFNGTVLTLNGNIVATNSIQLNAVSGSDVYNDTSTKVSPAAVGTGYNYFTIATLYFESFGNKVIVDSKAVCSVYSLSGTSGSQTFQVALFVDGTIVSCASEQKQLAGDPYVLPDGSNLAYFQDIPLPTFVFTPNTNVHTYQLKIIYSKTGGAGSYYVAAKNVSIKAVEYKR